MNILAVRIIKLGVPSSYVVDFCRPLILDCDYEFQAYDVGFVLKWYHNNHLIYQWIPPRTPYSFVSFFHSCLVKNAEFNFQSVFKYHINISFVITDTPKFKHRAIQLQPHYNLTGDWMCSVSSFHTRDRKIKTMKIIGNT